MILDYADRVRKLQQYHGDCSRLVRSVTQYIRSHISEPTLRHTAGRAVED
ncbi:hypothetical protein [uncultured Ruminococcus sp.]|nr:hypothetical protein [uncultured Ruminococcus sp.]